MTPRARRRILAVTAACGGAGLFAYAVGDAGWGEVATGIRRVGWGLVPILLIAGLRFVFRSEAWRRCMPPQVRIPFRQALAAYLAGDALGNVTPLGLVASEPTKVFLIRHRLATREAAASLAMDMFVYSTTVVVMIGAGLVALAATVPLPRGWREAFLIAALVLAAGLVAAWRLLGGTWSPARGARPRWRAPLARLRESVLAFSAGPPARLRRTFLLHAGFHALAFLEIFLALAWLLGEAPSVTEALIFTALDRVVIVAFKFVPFRIGVDEAAAGGLAALLGWSPAAGVTLAIVKKVRSLAWTGAGLALIAAHPAQAPEADRPGIARAHQT